MKGLNVSCFIFLLAEEGRLERMEIIAALNFASSSSHHLECRLGSKKNTKYISFDKFSYVLIKLNKYRVHTNIIICFSFLLLSQYKTNIFEITRFIIYVCYGLKLGNV